MNDSFEHWLSAMPKAELHLHIDGSLQARRLLSCAAKHGLSIPYKTEQDVAQAYNFQDLQSFLDLYYMGASVLRDEEDFYHLMMDYLSVCREQNIVHTEIMVEPQTYLPYGVSLDTILAGFNQAIDEANKNWQQSTRLILSFLRHLSEDDALTMLAAAEPHLSQFAAIGLASSELGHPPQKFERLYKRAKEIGLARTAHAGEEGPPEYIRDSLTRLDVCRIDHGIRAIEDADLVTELVQRQIPLTVCPLSNVKLRVFDQLSNHNLLALLELGLCVTVNSDDPAYFGGYMNENLIGLARDLKLNREQAIALNRNAFEASFLSQPEKQRFLDQFDHYVQAN